jgi:hypothetical protein
VLKLEDGVSDQICVADLSRGGYQFGNLGKMVHIRFLGVAFAFLQRLRVGLKAIVEVTEQRSAFGPLLVLMDNKTAPRAFPEALWDILGASRNRAGKDQCL